MEVKTAAAGIIRQILVKPGDRVEAGDLLAVVTSRRSRSDPPGFDEAYRGP